MAENRAREFADAVNRLESDGDVDAFVSGRFADNVVLLRPESGSNADGPAGAKQFWTEYLAQFDEIKSEFDRVGGTDEVAVLEWTSSGTRNGGSAISYRGVSIVDFDGQGTVSRFATYYDTKPFVTPDAA